MESGQKEPCLVERMARKAVAVVTSVTSLKME